MGKSKKRKQKLDIQELMDRNISQENEDLEQRLSLLHLMLESGVFTDEEIEDVRDGKTAIEETQLVVRIKGRNQRAVNGEPPKLAGYLAYLFLLRTDRAVLLGDLTEEYPSVVAKFGQRRAQAYFYKQVLFSIWPLARKAVIKWGVFGWVVEYIRRKIGS